MASEAKDVWAEGAAYELFMGRWSRLMAERFIEWLELPSGLRFIDVGCGSGALTQTIETRCDPAHIDSVDRSDGFIAHARRTIRDSRIAFHVADATKLPFESDSLDVAVSGLVLNFVPEPERMLREMKRVVRPLGVVGFYVWDYAEGMELLRHFWDAAASIDPASHALDEGSRFPICNPDRLSELGRASGLDQVDVRAIDVTTRFENFDDYWQPFLGGQGPAPSYVASLDEERRAVLRDRLRARLPTDADGGIDLRARAWALRGAK